MPKPRRGPRIEKFISDNRLIHYRSQSAESALPPFVERPAERKREPIKLPEDFYTYRVDTAKENFIRHFFSEGWKIVSDFEVRMKPWHYCHRTLPGDVCDRDFCLCKPFLEERKLFTLDPVESDDNLEMNVDEPPLMFVLDDDIKEELERKGPLTEYPSTTRANSPVPMALTEAEQQLKASCKAYVPHMHASMHFLSTYAWMKAVSNMETAIDRASTGTDDKNLRQKYWQSGIAWLRACCCHLENAILHGFSTTEQGGRPVIEMQTKALKYLTRKQMEAATLYNVLPLDALSYPLPDDYLKSEIQNEAAQVDAYSRAKAHMWWDQVRIFRKLMMSLTLHIQQLQEHNYVFEIAQATSAIGLYEYAVRFALTQLVNAMEPSDADYRPALAMMLEVYETDNMNDSLANFNEPIPVTSQQARVQLKSALKAQFGERQWGILMPHWKQVVQECTAVMDKTEKAMKHDTTSKLYGASQYIKSLLHIGRAFQHIEALVTKFCPRDKNPETYATAALMLLESMSYLLEGQVLSASQYAFFVESPEITVSPTVRAKLKGTGRILWKGLSDNRRARVLHHLAQALILQRGTEDGDDLELDMRYFQEVSKFVNTLFQHKMQGPDIDWAIFMMTETIAQFNHGEREDAARDSLIPIEAFPPMT